MSVRSRARTPRYHSRARQSLTRLVSATLAVLLAMLGVSVALPRPAAAAGTLLYVAQGGADTGPCSSAATSCRTVSYALTQAASGATIKVTGTIYDHVSVDKEVTITGVEAPVGSPAVIDGSNSGGVFLLTGPRVTLDHLRIQNGSSRDGGGILSGARVVTITDTTVTTSRAVSGGGIYQNGGDMTLIRSTVSDNRQDGGLGFGGGIFSVGGPLKLVDSTVSGNFSQDGPGGIKMSNDPLTLTRTTVSGNTGYGGGVEGGDVTVINSTITGNSAFAGGAFYVYNTGNLRVYGSTISGNSADHGGGIYNQFGTVTLGATLLSANTGGNCDRRNASPYVSLGYNLTSDATATACTLTHATDIIGANPGLGPLRDNGGPTMTMMPGLGSPARNVVPEGTTLGGVSVCRGIDQRGYLRPQPGASRCATGAVEPRRVTINQASGQADPTRASAVVFTATFGSVVSGFTSSDVVIGGTAPGTKTVKVTGGPTTYTVTVTGMTGPGTVVASIPANVVTGGNTASTSTDNSITYDNVAPRVTINQAANQTDPATTTPLAFTAVFSEPVTGFTGSDVTVGGTAGGTKTATVTGGPTTYTVTVSGMTGTGSVVASIPAGRATDLVGNASAASTSTDNSVSGTFRPVTINQAAGQADPTNGSSIRFTVTFGTAVTGFTGTDVVLGGTAPGTKTATVTGGPSTYTVTVSGMTGSGTVVASIPANAAAEGNLSSTSTDSSVTYDTVAPRVTINQASTQADPTSNTAINFTATFDEGVTGFTGSDVAIAGTAPGTKRATVTGGPTTYNVAVSGMTASGTVIVSIPAGRATDLAGNLSAASTSTDKTVSYTYVPPPTVTIKQGASQADPTNASTVRFDVVFSAAVTGLTSSDITVSGTAPGTKTVSVTGGPSTYAVTVTGMTGPGTVVASIPANVVIEGNTASTTTDNSVTFDNVKPIVTINQAASQVDPTSAAPVVFTVVLSEPVTSFTASHLVVFSEAVAGPGPWAPGTLAVTLSGGPTTFTAAVTGMTGSGIVALGVYSGTLSDAAGNVNNGYQASDNGVQFNYTTSGPTVTINQASTQVDPAATGPITFTATFTSAVTGFTASDVVISGTAPGAKTVVVTGDGTGSGYAVTVSGMTGPGTVVASIPADAAADGGGAPNLPSTSTDNTVTYAP